MRVAINKPKAEKKAKAAVVTLSSHFNIEVADNAVVATKAHVDAIHRLIEIQRQKKAIIALEEKEKAFLIKEMDKKEILIGKDGVELATYKRDADSTKWDKEALALLYPDVFADTRCVWSEKGAMRFLVKK